LRINIRDVLYWMDAIRQSDDRYRTLESFWKGQINSKVWLIDNLKHYFQRVPYDILICGGWNGVLATLMFNSELDILRITSLDKDPTCESIAKTMNKEYEIRSQFRAVTGDMLEYKNYNKHNLIINTACEHMNKEQYDKWLDQLPTNTRIIVQSNDYFDHKEHVNCQPDLETFKKTCGLRDSFAAELPTEKYKRFMIMGVKDGHGN
jgi:trans-aconitate methyltransferase